MKTLHEPPSFQHASCAYLGFKLSRGTLYPTLHALLDEKDVTVQNRIVNGKLRKVYRATRKGRKEAEEVIERLSSLIRKVFG